MRAASLSPICTYLSGRRLRVNVAAMPREETVKMVRAQDSECEKAKAARRAQDPRHYLRIYGQKEERVQKSFGVG